MTSTPRKTNHLMRRARISSGGVRSRWAFFGTARDNRFGTRDFYNGVPAGAMHCGRSRMVAKCTRHAGRYNEMVVTYTGSAPSESIAAAEASTAQKHRA